MAPGLALSGLVGGYRGAPPLFRELDVQVGPGEHVGLSGPSGIGKTSLVRICSGLYGVDSSLRLSGGTARFGTQDLLALSGPDARTYRGQRVGVITEDPVSGLHPQRSIGTTWRRFYPKLDLYEALQRYGLPPTTGFAERLPHQLSGGQAQRLRVAFALGSNPELLLMESPTAPLDAANAERVLREVELARQAGACILHVTHDEALLAVVSDRHYRLLDGRAVLVADEAVGSPEEATSPPDERLVLSATDLAVNYDQAGGATRIGPIDLSLRAGEILGLVGDSGSGKTSVGRALAGLIAHTGRVKVLPHAGESPRIRREISSRRAGPRLAVQYVFQEPRRSINPAFTVQTTLREAGAKTSDERRSLLTSAGLSEALLGRKALSLSTGQMQRLALARALAVQPAVLVCDEVLAAVDHAARSVIKATLTRLARERRIGVVFITHDRTALTGFAHRVIELASATQSP